MSEPEPIKKPRGCLFHGCTICVMLMLVVALVGYLSIRTIANRLNALIVENTETQPMPLPRMEMPADELTALEARVAAFNHATGTNLPSLRLTGRELNALLADSADMQHMKDWFWVSLEGDTIKAQVSLPLESQFKIPLIHFKGRYLNGSGVFVAAISNEMLWVRIQALEVKGKPLTEKFMQRLHTINFAENFNNSSNRMAIFRFGTMTVKDGVLEITPAERK